MSKPMDAETIAALQGSIDKWQAIVDGVGADMLADNCPLCAKFEDCEGCPVAERTSDTGCIGSPWEAWESAHHRLPLPWRVQSDHDKSCAQAELDFLKSLLPEGERA